MVFSCHKCQLSRGRLCIVRPWGTSPADALFLVEAPTVADERLKQLGRTPEYRLLAGMVTDAANRLGIVVPSYLIYPIISCRPSMGPQFPDRPPAQSEVLACAPHVLAAVAEAKPAAIFLMGKIVEHYWRKEYPDARVLLPLWLLMKQGGPQSPYYTSTIRQIAEGFQSIPYKRSKDHEKIT